jgi:hypothetical protein
MTKLVFRKGRTCAPLFCHKKGTDTGSLYPDFLQRFGDASLIEGYSVCVRFYLEEQANASLESEQHRDGEYAKEERA